MTVVLRMPTGRLRLSRMVYFSDLQRSDSREIPVGVVGEVALHPLRAIGIAVRPSFTEAELDLMGPTMRAFLRSPIDTLWPEMIAAFEDSATKSPLDAFAAHHASSFSVLAPEDHNVPLQWLLQKNSEKLSELVGDRMKVLLVDEYFKLLFPPRDPNGIDEPDVEERIGKLAA